VRRICLRCGTPADPARRCPYCGYRVARSTQAPRSGTEGRRRAAHVDAHVAAYGLFCPGHGTPPHYVEHRRDLTADHVVPVSLGGALEGGELAVLCRRCNARKGGRNRLRFPSRRGRVEKSGGLPGS